MQQSKQMNNDQMIKSMILNYLKSNIEKRKINLKSFLNRFEENIIKEALYITNGNQKTASEILGIKKSTLNEKIKRYGLNRGVDSAVIRNNIERLIFDRLSDI